MTETVASPELGSSAQWADVATVPPGPTPNPVQTLVPAPKVWATGMLLAASMTTSCFVGAPAARAISLEDYTSSPAEATAVPGLNAVQSIAPVSSRVSLASTERASELTTATLIKEMHSKSGLTWEQLSKALGVSRRSVHLWASGGRINARHVELLSELARLIDEAPVANPKSVRAWLLTSEAGRSSPLEAFKSTHRRTAPPVNTVGYTPSQLLGVDAD